MPQETVLLAHGLPKLGSHIGREGREQEHKRPQYALLDFFREGKSRAFEFAWFFIGSGEFSLPEKVEFVHEFHNGGDACVEMPATVKIDCDTPYSLVKSPLNIAARPRWFSLLIQQRLPITRKPAAMPVHEPVRTRQETMHALHTGLLPVQIPVRRRSEEGIHARGICSEAGHHIVRRNHVPLVLGHLGAALDDHALGKEPQHRLAVAHNADIAHELGPEARVNQVKNSVLYAADVLVNWKPVIHRTRIQRTIVKMRAGIAIKIPGRVDKGVHGISLAPRRAAAFWAGGIHKLRHLP